MPKPSPGLINQLSERVAQLEAERDALREQVSRLQSGHRDIISDRFIGIGLDTDGAILLQFPDQHTVRIPVGLLQADNALAMTALMRVLRDRAAAMGQPHTVGTRGAPTQYDLRAILAAVKATKPVTRVPSSRKSPAPSDLSLDDLDLGEL